MLARLARTLLACTPLLVVAACHGYRVTAPPTNAPTAAAEWEQERLRITFAAPRDLPSIGPAGDTAAMVGVVGVGCRLLAVRGDTLDLLMLDILPAGEDAPRWRSGLASPRRVAVIPTRADRVERMAVSSGRSIVLGVGIALAAVVLLLRGAGPMP